MEFLRELVRLGPLSHIARWMSTDPDMSEICQYGLKLLND